MGAAARGTATADNSGGTSTALRKKWEEERDYHENRPSILHYLFDAFAYHAEINRALSHLHAEGLLNLSRCLYFREEERRAETRKEYIKLCRPLPRKRPQTEPTLNLIKELLDLLDEDGNERIEWPEFRGFMITGAQMSPAARRALDQQSPTMRFSLQLLDNVLEENHLMMETALQEQYEYFDKDKSGTMELEELLHWMKSVHSETGSSMVEPTVEIAGYVIQFLDEDASGTLEQQEWLDWLREGHLTMLDEKRKRQYTSEGGDGAKCIVDFLAMVVLQASKRTGEMVQSMAAAYEKRLVKEQEGGAAEKEVEEDEKEEEEAVLSSESKKDEVKAAGLEDYEASAPANQQHGEFSSSAGEKSDPSPSLFRSSSSSEGKESDGGGHKHGRRHHRRHHRRRHHRRHHHNDIDDGDDAGDDNDNAEQDDDAADDDNDEDDDDDEEEETHI